MAPDATLSAATGGEGSGDLGNERLRPLVNRGPFIPFEVSWDAVRGQR